MKKGLKSLVALSAIGLALGAAVAVGAKQSNKVEETKALGEGNVYVRCTLPTTWNNDLKCHYWGGSSESAWPGVSAKESYWNNLGQKVSIYEIPSDSTGLLFDNGNNSWQTENLSLSGYNCWYLNSGITGNQKDYGTWEPSTYTIDVYDSLNVFSGNPYLHSYRGTVNNGYVEMQKKSLTLHVF